MIDVGSAVGYLLLDTKGFQSGFHSAMKDMKTFQDQSATVSDKFSAMGSALTSVGRTLTKSVTLPLVGLGATVTAMAANFETSMSKVAAIAGLDTAGKEFDALSEKAKEMGATTKFSASEAADAFTYMAMAGWKTESMLEGIDGIMSLAAASGEDLATTSDIVTDALTAFGLQASDSAHFADVLAAASNNANTNVSMLGESFKYVAPVAGALGYSAEDTSIALGLMANSGIKASQAGTALRTAMSNLVKPTDDMAAVMDQYGISLTYADGNMKSFMTIMTDLREKMGGLDEATQAAAASTLFGKEAMSGMLAIINASDEDFNNLTNSIYNADGTAAQMAATMQDNLTGQLTILKSALEGLAISFGEILIPYLTKAVQWLTGVIDKFNSMDESTKKLIVVVGTLVAAIGPVLLIIGKLSGAIGSIIGLIEGAGGLSAILTALTGPIGIVIAAVAALVAAWATNFGGIQEKTKEVVSIVKGWMSSLMDFLSSAWNNNLLGIRSLFEQTWSIIETIFGTSLDVMVGLFEIFDLALSGDWAGVWNRILELFVNVLSNILSIFGIDLDELVSSLLAIGVGLWDAAKRTFEQLKQGFTQKWAEVSVWWEEAKKDPEKALSEIGLALYNAASSAFTSLWDGFKSVWDSISNWVSEKVSWIVGKWNEANTAASSISGTGSQGSFASGLDYVPRDMNVRVHEGEAILTKQENTNQRTSGGDTFNFYSPKAISEVEAARQFRKVKQQLVEGMV